VLPGFDTLKKGKKGIEKMRKKGKKREICLFFKNQQECCFKALVLVYLDLWLNI
jgi:hypothetical protein